MGRKKDSISKILSIVLFLGLLLYTSCQNEAFLPDYQTDKGSTVSTSIREGAVLIGDQSVQLNLEYDEASERLPDYLEIQIFDQEGKSLGTQTIESDELFGPLPSVSTAENKQGMFSLELRLYDQQGELLEKKVVPFFKVQQYPRIVQIEAYPPGGLYPGSTGLLIPTVTGGNAVWVRWSIDSELLAKGPLKKFNGGFEWNAPAQEGVYSITLEVFPEVPPEGQTDFAFESPITSEVQLYVQGQSGSRLDDFGSENHYHTLMHLDGTFRDTGVHSANFSSIGKPVLAVDDNVFGYYFSSEDGVRSDPGEFSFSAPANSEPFSINLRLKPASDIQENTHLLSVQGSTGEDILQLLTDRGGAVFLQNPASGEVLQRPDNFSFKGLRELSISFVPQNEGVTIKWYRNGRLVYRGSISNEQFTGETWFGLQLGGALASGGTSGEKGGFEGLFDELGIYAYDEAGEPSADTGIYKRWVQRELGEREVLAAEGFESRPKDTLPVGSGSSSVLAELKQNWEKVWLNIYFENGLIDPEAAMQIGPKDGPKVRIRFDGTIMKPEDSNTVPTETIENQSAGFAASSKRGIERISPDALLSNETATLNIVRRAGDVAVLTEEGKLLFSSDAWENQVVQVEIMKAAAADPEDPEDPEGREDPEDPEGSSPGTNETNEANIMKGPMQVSELLLLRDTSTFKEFE